MFLHSDAIRLLRGQIDAITLHRPLPRTAVISSGHPGIDLALGGGFARGHMHEAFVGDAGDGASGAGFVAMLARRAGRGVVWLREQKAERLGGSLHAWGLAEVGIDPNRLLLGVLPDALAVLRAAVDVARCSGVGVAVVELWGAPRVLDLTASRRLALAAEASGVPLILLRIDAEPMPSATQTRWRVSSIPSTPLEANAPGHPALEVELLRQRGRAETGRWQVEWDRERAVFRDIGRAAPSSGAVVSLPSVRPAAADIVPLRRTG